MGACLEKSDGRMDEACWERPSSREERSNTMWANSYDLRLTQGGELLEELEHAARWIETQRRQLSGTTPDVAYVPEVLPETLNESQRQCEDVVKAHFETGGDGAPLRVML